MRIATVDEHRTIGEQATHQHYAPIALCGPTSSTVLASLSQVQNAKVKKPTSVQSQPVAGFGGQASPFDALIRVSALARTSPLFDPLAAEPAEPEPVARTRRRRRALSAAYRVGHRHV